MTLKPLATGAAAVAVLGAAAAGATCMTIVIPVTSPVRPAVFGVPMPQQPAPDVPSAGELVGVLTNLADPDVPFADKTGLVEGGVSPMEANVADKRLQKAAHKGQMPLSFSVANIAPTTPETIAADVTASGPKLSPRTMNMTFINQGSWKLSRSSAMSLLQATSGS